MATSHKPFRITIILRYLTQSMDVRAKTVIRSLHLLHSKPIFIQSYITSLLTTNVFCHLEDQRQDLTTLRRLGGELALFCEVASI